MPAGRPSVPAARRPSVRDGRPMTVSPASSASPEEAAAIVAALERFMRATAPLQSPVTRPSDPWREAALIEGVSRQEPGDLAGPWINT